MKETFGAQIRNLRIQKKYTLKELSQKSGIELTYLSKIENDKMRSPKKDTIEKLAYALGVDNNVKHELFRLADQMPPDLKDHIIKDKNMFEVFRSTQNLSAEDLLQIVEEIKKRKQNK